MPKNIKIQINSAILAWAREEAGYTPGEIAKKLKVPTDRYLQWESDEQAIPLGMLKQIAKDYKRQLAVFLLPAPPPKTKKPRDFRNLAISQEGLSPHIMLAIRRANKYIAMAGEILGKPYWGDQYQWQTEINQFKISDTGKFNEDLIEWLRTKLKITINDQKNFRGTADAFRKWRNSLERELGIFIFQFDMPQSEVDGFCYAEDDPPYAIVINKNIAHARKIFTLFHELAHIIRHQSGICQAEVSADEQGIEFECNDFAGKFLVPDSEIIQIAGLEELTTIAREYNVSREVYLRRNLERELISRTDFFSLLEDVRKVPKTPSSKKTGYASPLIKSKSTRGNKFYNLVINAVCENKIDYLSASDVLGLGYSYIAAHE
ncbi:XRE family transcriptional regulator [bacterium]|nr:XRE family transcriptional regulator [bacterium]